MWLMHLIGIGRLRSGPEAELFDRYNRRLRPSLTIIELPEKRGTPLEIRKRESVALINALPKDPFVVPLDLGGKTMDSEEFASRLDNWSNLARTICFLIGGAEGLDGSITSGADYVLSFGLMTWPHFLVRAMLAEQLFRAQAIRHRHPYHKAKRP